LLLFISQVTQHLENIDDVGKGIAVAFVATIYGVGSANILFLPFAGKLKPRLRNSSLMSLCIIEWKGKNDTNAAMAAWEKLFKSNPDFPRKDTVEDMIAEAKGQVNTVQQARQPDKN
jgi:flagellar motor component MotA